MGNRLKPKRKLIENPVLLVIGLLMMLAGEVIYNFDPEKVVLCTFLLVAALVMVVISVWPKKNSNSPRKK